MSRSTQHLDAERTAAKEASIELVRDYLAGCEVDGLTIAKVADATGLSGRTLRRPHILPLVEAKAGRSFSEGSSGSDPRTVRSLERKLREALDRVGRTEDRLAERNRTITLRDERIAELQGVIDLLSMQARALFEETPSNADPAPAAGAGTPRTKTEAGSAQGSRTSSRRGRPLRSRR